MKQKTTISLSKDSHWKLLEVKAKLRASTWDDFAEKIYALIVQEGR